MIALTIITNSSPPITHYFDQPSVIIGCSQAQHADLKLSDSSLQESHLQITRQVENGKTSFFISNLANDPFVTLNHLSFGKQPIFSNDEVQIGEISIRFEDIPESHSEDLLSPGSLSAPQSVHHAKPSLKDYYLSEYDDKEELPWPHDKNPGPFQSPELAKSWRISLTLFTGLLGITVLIASAVLLWVSDQNEKEEKLAAKGVADIAMSLTYSRLKHPPSQNQNPSYPELIKNNLMPILASNYQPLAEVDAHGQFANCPYLLRIYTSTDFSNFLVIAQPSPSLLQWLIPKASIIVDSKAMEMRKIKDLKVLNRLIANPNPLDGSNSSEISNLVKQGELIPLYSLVSKAENQGLAPPETLALIRPGAENLLYNAPRYYLLGETILNKSLDLADKFTKKEQSRFTIGPLSQFPDKEISLFLQELDFLLQLPNLVLYSSSGIRHTLKAQQALSSFMPHDKFLIAYLQLNNHGKIGKTQLLKQDISSASALLNEVVDSPWKSAIFNNEKSEQFLVERKKEGAEDSQKIYESEMDDPLFLELSSIANARQTSLKPIADEMIELLKKETFAAQSHFVSRFSKLQKKYHQTNREQKNKIFKKFENIIQENEDLPTLKFIELIRAADLESLFQDYLEKSKHSSSIKKDRYYESFMTEYEMKEWLPLKDGI